MDMNEVKTLIEKQGEAFEAFKATLDSEMKTKLAKDDPIITEKLIRIEKSLDDAVEAKAKIEAAIEAERKEREDLEVRLNRHGIKAGGEVEDKAELELKEFNLVLQSLAGERKKTFTPLDHSAMAEFKAAQVHLLRNGKDDLSPEEVKVLSVGSDPDGGYFVTPDMTGRMVTKVYETSPIRQIASQQTISTDALEGIEDLDEAGAGYAGEKATSANADTPDVGKWRIPVFWIDTEPKATQQLLDDAAVDIEAWLSGKVGDKFGRFENAEFVTGAAGKIRGLTGYTTAADTGSGVTWGTIGHHVTGVNGDFASSNPTNNIHDLMGLLKDAYLSNARFLTRRSAITKIRKWKDGVGRDMWQPSFAIGVPETIAGYPVTRAEDMPALATDSLSLAFGDFRAAYQIVDRQGIRVLRDPYTAKPFIKFYTTKRTGGGVVNFEAIKFLKFAA
jgi:HK97 family phage major capsid protein